MSRRGLFNLLNTVLLGISLIVMFLFPQYAAFALYAIVGWLAAGLTLTWSGWGSPNVSSGSSPALSAAPLSGPGAPEPIDFCLYCGSYFAPGARSCSSCGKPLPGAAGTG